MFSNVFINKFIGALVIMQFTECRNNFFDNNTAPCYLLFFFNNEIEREREREREIFKMDCVYRKVCVLFRGNMMYRAQRTYVIFGLSLYDIWCRSVLVSR